MTKYTFTINYTISCGNFSRNKTETFTVEHNDPLTAWQPLHSHCVELNRAAQLGGCTINKLVAKDENGKVVIDWK
jgi:hypothetical protein